VALLEMQGLEPSRARGGCDDHCAGSDVSLLLCDSLASVVACL
jgi:Lanthionine-containing peptide SapB precursor RamS